MATSLLERARTALREGDLATAEASAREALEEGEGAAHALLVRILHARGRFDEAERHLETALARDPQDALMHAYRGAILRARGDSAAAVPHYRTAIRLAPDVGELHNELGMALAEVGEYVAAEAALRRALELRPDLPQIHNNLGGVLKELGRYDEAIACYRAALDRAPRYLEALGNLGVVLQLAGDLDAATGCYRRVLAEKPDDALAWTHLGTALAAKGRLTEAVAAHERALALEPGLAEAHNNLGIALKDQGRLGEAAAAYRRALALRPDDPRIHSNLLLSLIYDPAIDGSTLLAAHREWAVRHEPAATAAFPNTREPERVLRIGFVSPDFYSHSVASFFEPVLACRDRTRTVVVCYSDVVAGDEVTARLREMADLWRDVAGLGDAALYERIRADRIDILVDLAGHTAHNRLPVFARRAAPIQVTWIGYPATTGLSRIDYRITDRWADPPGTADRWCSERLLRLDCGFLCYGPPRDCPAPSAAGRGGPVTFGSFNNLSKIGDEVIRIWARVLHAVPGSRLLLKSRQLADPDLRARLAGVFADYGIAPKRLDLRGRIADRAAHLALYREVDVALDTFPYNGTTTTCEALWMGVPVVTLEGKLHAGRVGVSLLERAGLGDCVARSAEEYVAIATRLAKRRPAPAELRRKIAASPLTDATTFAEALEATWRKIWSRWCDEAAE